MLISVAEFMTKTNDQSSLSDEGLNVSKRDRSKMAGLNRVFSH